MKNEITTHNKRQITDELQRMLEVCPNPTDVEIRKLLSIQGFLLQQLGIELLHTASQEPKLRNKRPTINLARSCLQDARKSLEAASRTTNNE
jgi:hypothetical protein